MKVSAISPSYNGYSRVSKNEKSNIPANKADSVSFKRAEVRDNWADTFNKLESVFYNGKPDADVLKRSRDVYAEYISEHADDFPDGTVIEFDVRRDVDKLNEKEWAPFSFLEQTCPYVIDISMKFKKVNDEVINFLKGVINKEIEDTRKYPLKGYEEEKEKIIRCYEEAAERICTPDGQEQLQQLQTAAILNRHRDGYYMPIGKELIYTSGETYLHSYLFNQSPARNLTLGYLKNFSMQHLVSENAARRAHELNLSPQKG